jgi:hypothetical protein
LSDFIKNQEFFIKKKKYRLFDWLKVRVTVELKNFHKQINLEVDSSEEKMEIE